MAEKNKRSDYTYDFQKNHYERISLQVPRGEKAEMVAYAELHGFKSLNAFIYDAIKKEMER